MCKKPIKSELDFRVPCVKCGQLINITFDEDGDVEGNVIQIGSTWSELFQSWCTPLGLRPGEEGTASGMGFVQETLVNKLY